MIDSNNTFKHILSKNVELNVSIDDDRLKSNLKTNQAFLITEKSFFYTILGFSRSRSYPSEDVDEFYQLVAGSYKTDRPINITGVDKVHLKCDCFNISIVNGVREPIL